MAGAANQALGYNNRCIEVMTNTAGLGIAVSFSSVLSNGVRLVTAPNVSSARLLNAVMFSGSDVEFGCSGANLANGAATATITHNLSGMPDCVILLTENDNGSINGGGAATPTVGFWDGTNSIGFAAGGVNVANPTNLYARCGTANMGQYLSQTPADQGAWTIESVGATTLVVRRPATTGGVNALVIAWRNIGPGIDGCSAFLDQTPTSTGTHVVNTGMTVRPQLWLNIPTRLTATTFVSNDDTAGCWGLCAAVSNAATGTTQYGAVAASAQNGVATSVAHVQTTTTLSSVKLNNVGNAQDYATTVASWDAGGVTETISTAASSLGERINLMYGITPPQPALMGQIVT